MTLDVGALRAAFPALDGPTAYFDGPGGTQTPTVVGEAIARTLTGPLSNRGTGSASQRNADAVVRAFRTAYADLLGAVPDGVVQYIEKRGLYRSPSPARVVTGDGHARSSGDRPTDGRPHPGGISAATSAGGPPATDTQEVPR